MMTCLVSVSRRGFLIVTIVRLYFLRFEEYCRYTIPGLFVFSKDK